MRAAPIRATCPSTRGSTPMRGPRSRAGTAGDGRSALGEAELPAGDEGLADENAHLVEAGSPVADEVGGIGGDEARGRGRRIHAELVLRGADDRVALGPIVVHPDDLLADGGRPEWR